jgi:hypothetical protein
MGFLVANNWTVTSENLPELHAKKHRFAGIYKNYSQSHAWFEKVLARRFDSMHQDVPEADRRYDIQAATAVVTDIGEQYHAFNDYACTDLRVTLQNMEGRRAGRVRLSTFYNATRYSHWKFTESPEYLRALGALDETDAKQPAVLIPNYVMARGNCLNAFHIYAICCRNACEDMMGQLERKLGTPVGSAKEIAGIIAELPSESVAAPRNLSESLLNRLDEVAQHHGGQIPLHGRLFAQWMHHAYPLDCAYPHEQGTTNPQTPQEWSRQTGQQSDASQEEMHAQVESDSCAVNWEGRSECDESSELPWTPVEELIAVHRPAAAGAAAEGVTASTGSAEKPFFAVLGLFGLGASWWCSKTAGRGDDDSKSQQLPAPAAAAVATLGLRGFRRSFPWPTAGLLRVLALACLARAADLLNGALLAGGIAFGVLSLAISWSLNGSTCGALQGGRDIKCI